jgi:hypothetical protein
VRGCGQVDKDDGPSRHWGLKTLDAEELRALDVARPPGRGQKARVKSSSVSGWSETFLHPDVKDAPTAILRRSYYTCEFYWSAESPCRSMETTGKTLPTDQRICDFGLILSNRVLCFKLVRTEMLN